MFQYENNETFTLFFEVIMSLEDLNQKRCAPKVKFWTDPGLKLNSPFLVL
jgi:hypothetical protein